MIWTSIFGSRSFHLETLLSWTFHLRTFNLLVISPFGHFTFWTLHLQTFHLLDTSPTGHYTFWPFNLQTFHFSVTSPFIHFTLGFVQIQDKVYVTHVTHEMSAQYTEIGTFGRVYCHTGQKSIFLQNSLAIFALMPPPKAPEGYPTIPNNNLWLCRSFWSFGSPLAQGDM